MRNSGSLTNQERADLVAFLDGELDEEAARALEAKLSINAEARTEAEELKRAWELLDFLPQQEPSADFTSRTLLRSTPMPATRGPRPAGGSWLRVALLLCWMGGVAFSAWGGYAAFQYLAPPLGDRELLRDLRVIEHKRLYELAGDLEFLKKLDDPELFGDDAGR